MKKPWTEPRDVRVKFVNLKGPVVHTGQGRGGCWVSPAHAGPNPLEVQWGEHR